MQVGVTSPFLASRLEAYGGDSFPGGLSRPSLRLGLTNGSTWAHSSQTWSFSLEAPLSPVTAPPPAAAVVRLLGSSIDRDRIITQLDVLLLLLRATSAQELKADHYGAYNLVENVGKKGVELPRVDLLLASKL